MLTKFFYYTSTLFVFVYFFMSCAGNKKSSFSLEEKELLQRSRISLIANIATLNKEYSCNKDRYGSLFYVEENKSYYRCSNPSGKKFEHQEVNPNEIQNNLPPIISAKEEGSWDI